MTFRYDQFGFVIGTIFAKLALVVAQVECEYIESGVTRYIRCLASYECCSENRECCKKPVVYGPPNFVSCRDFRNLFFLPKLPSAKKTYCRDCSRDSASCQESRQEAESRRQSRQWAVYSNEEEKMPMVIIVGIALGSLLLVCIIVAIVTAVACSFSKRSRRVGTISRRGNAEAQLRLPSTSIRQPPPYELSGYAPPSYPGTRINTNETAVLTQNMPLYKF